VYCPGTPLSVRVVAVGLCPVTVTAWADEVLVNALAFPTKMALTL
jgi:hypothetical protein